jgi:hypothetical protein
MPTQPVPSSSTSADSHANRNTHRASVLSEIDFVQTLSSKLAPAPASPKGPSETEKKLQAEIKKLGDIVSKRERDEEIAAAVAKAKAEVKKEKEFESQKPQQLSNCTGSCGCCPGNASSRTVNIQDGFAFHLHTHGNDVPVANNVNSQGPGRFDTLAGGLYERRKNSVGDAAMGVAKWAMERMHGIEARTALLERELDIGWDRQMDQGSRRFWERERERDRYPGSGWGRWYI